MGTLAVFTDVSLNAQAGIGFAACLILPEEKLFSDHNDAAIRMIRFKRFASSSSTRLELESLLWAFQEVEEEYREMELRDNLIIYTDSQCIAGLLNRRDALERTDFTSGKRRALNNAALYRRFYALHDTYKFTVIQLKGHSKKCADDRASTVFACVDRAVRKELKNTVAKNRSVEMNRDD